MLGVQKPDRGIGFGVMPAAAGEMLGETARKIAGAADVVGAIMAEEDVDVPAAGLGARCAFMRGRRWLVHEEPLWGMQRRDYDRNRLAVPEWFDSNGIAGDGKKKTRCVQTTMW